MEVLAARWRLGETQWPFPRRLRHALCALEGLGLLWFESDITPGYYRVVITEAGRAAAMSATYDPPAERLRKRGLSV
jgi:hypothetical protein